MGTLYLLRTPQEICKRHCSRAGRSLLATIPLSKINSPIMSGIEGL